MDYLNRNTDYERPEVASTFDELSLWSSYFGRLLLEHIPMQIELKLLDVGCGNGFPLFELAHCLGPKGHYTGIDAWKSAHERALTKKEVYGLTNVELVFGDAHELPWEAATFDWVVSSIGVNNFSDPQRAIQECSRVLKPGGKMILTTNLRGHMQELYEVYEKVLTKLNIHQYLPALRKNIDHRVDLPTISDWLESADLKIGKIVEDAFVMRYASGSALLRHSLTIFGFLEGWRKIITPEHERLVFGELEQQLNEIAQENGELRMTVPIAYVESNKG